jgi:hypothetical protein
VISEGEFEHTFDVPGTYDYYCIPHRLMGMVGRIVVGEPAGPAEESSIPDGDVPESEEIVEEGIVVNDGSTGDDDAEMMSSGPGMMGGGGPGWMMLMPIGFLTAIIGAAGGIVYWFSGQGNSAA